MWPFAKQKPLQADSSEPHPLALRIYEIEQSIERGHWGAGGKLVGAFAVVARMLAEQESRIKSLEGGE